MAISAKDVSELRAKTGVGMMDCKKALEDTNGDFDEAIKMLKEKGLVVAAKKAERVTAEGAVDILYDEATKTAAMIEVNIETDFAAKADSFRAFVRGCLEVIHKENPADVGELLAKPFGDGQSVDDMLKEKIQQIGENITIRRFVTASGELSTYVHNKGAIGVIVKVEPDEAALSDPGFPEFKKNLALQVASMNPLYVDKADVPESVKQEIEIQVKTDEDNAKKPANVIEKMVEGKIRKYFEDKCLLQQGYIKEDKLDVGEYVENYKKQSGSAVKVEAFHRFEKGEGIQKKEDNFAEEIAQLTQK